MERTVGALVLSGVVLGFGFFALKVWAANGSSAHTAGAQEPAAPVATAPAQVTPRRQTLRVGMTEDYRPFSYVDPLSHQLNGIDVALANELGRFLRLKVQIVKTSWQTLRQDYESGLFDIAMSGIARTPEREKWARFSQGYSVEGKTAIARCDQKAKFDSLPKIDRSGVRVVVNPGGTNQGFVTKHLRRATVVQFADNAQIFAQLTDRKADVMITDSMEAAVQASLNHDLCVTMPSAKLEPMEQAILVVNDDPLLKKINVWLDLIKSNGKLAGVILKYTNP